nr:hypothetical protein [Tanacetum cinerariifolium]
MTSFGYRLNPRYAIKECLSCGALYTEDLCCSKGNVEDKILVPKLPKNYASTNVVNAPREPFVVKQDHSVNPPHIDECCCECGDALDGIYCQQYICKSCGKVPCISKPNFVDESSNIFNPPPQPPIYSCEFYGSNAQYGHYCTPQVPFIIPEPESFAFDDDDEDDDVDYTIAITPALSTEETDNSLSMGDEHLDTILATKLDELIKSSVENLVPIPSESEGIPDTMCDVHLVSNPTPLEAKDHFEIALNSNDD